MNEEIKKKPMEDPEDLVLKEVICCRCLRTYIRVNLTTRNGSMWAWL